MNRNYQIFLIAIVAVFTLTSCSVERETVQTTDAEENQTETNLESAESIELNADESLITWNGYKAIIDTEHEGTIKLSDGEFLVEDGELVGGNFTIDTTTVDNKDLDGGMKEGLLNHLNSEEMLDTSNFPTGSFEITKVMPIQENGFTHQISGNLTLKDTTKNITFKSNISGLDSEEITATADFNIDRQLWNIGHSDEQSVVDSLKDNALKNEVRIRLDLQS